MREAILITFVLVASITQAVADYYTYEIVLRNPAVMRAWQSIVPPNLRNEKWIMRIENGTAVPVNRVISDHKPFYLGSFCQPHLCAGNYIVFLIAIDGSEAYGMLRSEDRNATATFFGNPDVERQELMIKEMASTWMMN